MSAEEEQAQELEILESIYPDELEVITPKQFVIHLSLETVPIRYLDLKVQYPDEYPEQVPELQIQLAEKRLGEEDEEEDEEDIQRQQDDRIVEYADIEFDQADCDQFERILRDAAEENLGTPSVFTLVSLLKEEGENEFTKKCEAKDKEKEQQVLKQEAEDRKKFIGTPVTPESFAQWREKFRTEMGYDKLLEEAVKLRGGKLTGREIFERGLNKEDEEGDDDDDISTLANSVEQVQV